MSRRTAFLFERRRHSALARGEPDPLTHPTSALIAAWDIYILCAGCEEHHGRPRCLAHIQRAGGMDRPFAFAADIQDVELKGKAGLRIACYSCSNANRKNSAKRLEWSEIKALLDNLEASGPGTPPLTVTR
jgi:hypothetical protein